MESFFLKILIKYLTFAPNDFLPTKKKYTKSEILFNTIQYKSDYNTDTFLLLYLPLLLNIVQISNNIKKHCNSKNLISITSTIVFYEKESNNEYTHSLADSNQLYSVDSLNKWTGFVFFNILKKMEIYNSFRKISIITQVKTITKV